MLSLLPAAARRTLAARTLANLSPAIFAWFSSWDILGYAFVYWFETVIIVLLGTLRFKIMAGRVPGTPVGVPLVVAGQLLGYTALSWLMLVSAFRVPIFPPLWMFFQLSMLLTIVLYLATHIHSFIVHFLPVEGARRSDLSAEYARPYMRVVSGIAVIVLVARLDDGFLDPRVAMVGLALLKTVVDGWVHAVAHKLQG